MRIMTDICKTIKTRKKMDVLKKARELDAKVQASSKKMNDALSIIESEEKKRVKVLAETDELIALQKERVISKLKETRKYLKTATIESEIGIPQNVLSKVILYNGNLTAEQVVRLYHFFNSFSI